MTKNSKRGNDMEITSGDDISVKRKNYNHSVIAGLDPSISTKMSLSHLAPAITSIMSLSGLTRQSIQTEDSLVRQGNDTGAKQGNDRKNQEWKCHKAPKERMTKAPRVGVTI